MQISIIGHDVISPVYTCGKNGEKVDVQTHGVNYSTWKLIDDFEKHVGKKSKTTCKICNGEQGVLDKVIEAMQAVGSSAKDITPTFTEMAMLLGFDSEKETND